MVATFGKFLGQFFTPLGIIALLLFFGLIRARRDPRALWMPTLALILIAVLGNAFFANILTRSLEWRYMPPTSGNKGDVIVLVAGGMLPQEAPRQLLEVDDRADRVFLTVKLYFEGAAPRIIVTGSAQSAADVKTELVGLGVPEAVIAVQDKSSSPLDDARFAAELIKANAYQMPILVTSALEMDKMVYLFTKSGVSVSPVPADFTVTQPIWEKLTKPAPFSVLSNLMPTAAAFEQSCKAITEYTSLVYYRLRAIF